MYRHSVESTERIRVKGGTLKKPKTGLDVLSPNSVRTAMISISLIFPPLPPAGIFQILVANVAAAKRYLSTTDTNCRELSGVWSRLIQKDQATTTVDTATESRVESKTRDLAQEIIRVIGCLIDITVKKSWRWPEQTQKSHSRRQPPAKSGYQDNP